MHKKLSIIIISCIAIGSILYWNYTKSPKYSLAQIEKSFKQHDISLFEKYIDIESLTNSLINDILDVQKKDVAKNNFENLGESLGRGLVELLKPQFSQIAKQQLIKYVETGDLEKQKHTNSTNNQNFSLLNILEKSGGTKSGFKGIEYIKKDGKVAYVGIVLYNEDYNTNLILDLKMRDRGGYWQLIELSNFKDYINEIDDLESKKINELNIPIIKEMGNTLNTEYFQTKNVTDSFGIEKKILFTLELKNVGTKEIDEYKININCSTIDKKAFKKVELVDKSNISPGNIGRGSWYVNMNIFDQNDKLIFETPQRNLKIDGEIEYVKFVDGSELKLFKKYQTRGK